MDGLELVEPEGTPMRKPSCSQIIYKKHIFTFRKNIQINYRQNIRKIIFFKNIKEVFKIAIKLQNGLSPVALYGQWGQLEF